MGFLDFMVYVWELAENKLIFLTIILLDNKEYQPKQAWYKVKLKKWFLYAIINKNLLLTR